MSHDKLIDKLRKMQAHAESAAAIGSEAEAQAFASKIQTLLLEHKLEMSDIEFEQLEREDPVIKKFVNYSAHNIKHRSNRVEWMEKLAGIVANAHFCRIVVHSGSSNISLLGRKEDIEVAEYLIVTLIRATEKIAKYEHSKYSWECFKAHKSTAGAKGFKESFIRGFILRLHERFIELQRRKSGESSTALVRINRSLQAVDAYIQRMKEADKNDPDRLKTSTKLVTTRKISSHTGYQRGREKADSLNLDANALKTGESRGQLR